MIVFCLTIHHLLGRTLDKPNQDACAVAYADDGYIKAKLSVALEVLSDIKLVLKEDAGLDINDKTKRTIKEGSSFLSGVSRRLRRTRPHNACLLLIPPSPTSVLCSPPRPL